jgi:hypothetical protein
MFLPFIKLNPGRARKMLCDMVEIHVQFTYITIPHAHTINAMLTVGTEPILAPLQHGNTKAVYYQQSHD